MKTEFNDRSEPSENLTVTVACSTRNTVICHLENKVILLILIALLFSVGGKVVIVIGGDKNYTENEEGRSVISVWARRALSRQISEEYLDGRKSFIFSWDKKHRPIHEEALKHFFDPGRNGERFIYPLPTRQADPGSITSGCSAEKEPAVLDLGRIEGAAEIEPITPAEATSMEVEEEKGIYFIVTRCFILSLVSIRSSGIVRIVPVHVQWSHRRSERSYGNTT